MLKIIYYVPEEGNETVKEALFAAGAGQIGNYSHCAWQILGQGQFIPRDNSNPSKGSHNNLEKITDYAKNSICTGNNLKSYIA